MDDQLAIKQYLSKELGVTHYRIQFTHATNQGSDEELPRFVEIHAPHQYDEMVKLAVEIGLSSAVETRDGTLILFSEDVVAKMKGER